MACAAHRSRRLRLHPHIQRSSSARRSYARARAHVAGHDPAVFHVKRGGRQQVHETRKSDAAEWLGAAASGRRASPATAPRAYLPRLPTHESARRRPARCGSTDARLFHVKQLGSQLPPPRAERLKARPAHRDQGSPQTIGSGRTDRWVRCPEVRSMGYFATRSPPFDRHLKDRAGGRDLWPSRRGSTRSMTLLLAAVGATLMALLELTVGPYLQVGLAQPHLVLVVGIVVTVAVGLEAGLVWAFVGGLVLDVIVDRPLGSTSFALLLCVGATAVLARLLARFRPVVPIAGHPRAQPVLLDDVVRGAQRPPVADPRRRSIRRRPPFDRLRHDPGGPHRAPGDLHP